MLPHNAPPQSATRTRDLPPSVSQVPSGSAAHAVPALETSVAAANAGASRRNKVLMAISVFSAAAARRSILTGPTGRSHAAATPTSTAAAAAGRPAPVPVIRNALVARNEDPRPDLDHA